MVGKALVLQPKYNILDTDGTTIATIKGFKSMLHGNNYWIENTNGDEIMRAKSVMEEKLFLKYQILDPVGSIIVNIADIASTWGSFGLNRNKIYSVDILSQNTNKYLILAMVACIDFCQNYNQ